MDFQVDLPREKLINFHGSLANVECEFCKAPYESAAFLDAVRSKIKNIYDPTDAEAPAESSNILCPACGAAGVKPSTVMYGCSIPQPVYDAIENDFPGNVDLVIVMGTSLTVYPAAGLVRSVHPDVPRILLNNEQVGHELGLNFEGKDIFVQGSCDDGVLKLAKALGWLDELARYQDRMCPASRAAVIAAVAAEATTVISSSDPTTAEDAAQPAGETVWREA